MATVVLMTPDEDGAYATTIESFVTDREDAAAIALTIGGREVGTMSVTAARALAADLLGSAEHAERQVSG